MSKKSIQLDNYATALENLQSSGYFNHPGHKYAFQLLAKLEPQATSAVVFFEDEAHGSFVLRSNSEERVNESEGMDITSVSPNSLEPECQLLIEGIHDLTEKGVLKESFYDAEEGCLNFVLLPWTIVALSYGLRDEDITSWLHPDHWRVTKVRSRLVYDNVEEQANEKVQAQNSAISYQQTEEANVTVISPTQKLAA